MRCSQCQVGRAWDAYGRCEPCSRANVNLGPAGSQLVATGAEPPGPDAAEPRPEAGAVPPRPFPSAAQPPAPPPPAPRGACTQCFAGTAWDDEGRCRPCSEAGVRLTAAPPRTAPAIETAEPLSELTDGSAPRRRLSFLSRRS
ncbi:hypothetical protein [Streptomyces sp. ST2-7A]|uniref:hypothetical protein n=1 Tax=Streptomyces sp. ST2-7A TaxID=2907214 RepID=UPI001F440BDE|nr:hypothetical protein [Streptomyces sp. ST2-7A]MCE7082650.1 hypothetical protein [Streptomyces sp. ST2-7A]